MAQSFFALLALVVAVNMALSVNSWYASLQRATIFREVQEMAQSVAVETIEIVRVRAFDQAVVDGLVTGTSADILLFTDPAAFGTQGNALCQPFGGTATCDDLDDFHGQVARRPFVMGRDTVWFQVRLSVRYVNYDPTTQAITAATGKTAYKEVRVEVQDDWGGAMTPFIHVPIYLERVFAYGF
ncbi:hypothetical protein [Rhodothermus bifroesti]|uniref:hypothetical protein n=1 Tax=Rhodothermus bifroesti TaxID=2823335 RepID=UPI001AF012C3|nr:hypothetical protein [Rhodothermus bifroesti]